jgi:hypothetical protein
MFIHYELFLVGFLGGNVLRSLYRWDEVGVVYHYQLVRPWGRQRLNRVGGVPAGATPLDVQPYFPVGKGVVGAAVRQQCLVAVAWRDFVQRWFVRTPQQWAAQDVQDRYGLNWGSS